MDLSQSIVPKSDQLNADDLMGGARTFTITEVSAGNTEQPVNVGLADSRPFRPSKSMLRVMVAAWGLDGTEWSGHKVTLYRDPKVKWAGQEVGGIRISHMTGIDGPLKLALTETRGKRAMFTVQPLTDEPSPTPKPADPDAVTPAQLKKIGAAMRDLGMTDRDKALEFVARTITREVSSRDELTKAEASVLIDELEELATGQQDEQPVADAGADPWAGEQS